MFLNTPGGNGSKLPSSIGRAHGVKMTGPSSEESKTGSWEGTEPGITQAGRGSSQARQPSRAHLAGGADLDVRSVAALQAAHKGCRHGERGRGRSSRRAAACSRQRMQCVAQVASRPKCCWAAAAAAASAASGGSPRAWPCRPHAALPTGGVVAGQHGVLPKRLAQPAPPRVPAGRGGGRNDAWHSCRGRAAACYSLAQRWRQQAGPGKRRLTAGSACCGRAAGGGSLEMAG